MTHNDPRLQRLLERLSGLGPAVAAYSGGVDSTLAAWAAHQVLGDRFLALTVRSALQARRDLALALDKARGLGFRHRVLDLDVFAAPGLAANPPERCYLCKRSVLGLIRAAVPDGTLLDGTNADDDPARPGRRALAEFQAVSPLAETGLAKADVRELSRLVGLPGWDEPSNSCLATRLATGTALTSARLARVEALEELCRAHGLRGLRCRDREPLLVLEFDPAQAGPAAAATGPLKAKALSLGFQGLELRART